MRDADRWSAVSASEQLDMRLRIFTECYLAYFRARGEQDLLQSVCEILVSRGEFGLSWIGYGERNSDKVIPVAKAGVGVDYLDHIGLSRADEDVGHGPFAIAIRTQKPCWINDIKNDPRDAPWRAAAVARGYASCIALPLIAESETQGTQDLHGTLNLYSATLNAFDETSIAHCIGLASYVTVAVTTLRSDLAGELIQGTAALRANEERRRAQESHRAARAEIERVTLLMAKGAIAAQIAHEIKQPLGAIAAYAAAARRFLSKTPPDRQQALNSVEEIANDAHRASAIIKSIRGMFQHEKDTKAALDLNEVIHDVIDAVSPELHRQRVSLQLDLAEPLPGVTGDRVQLQQLIYNLILNAIDAMSEVKNRPRVLRIHSANCEPTEVLVAVEDSGIGIDPKNIERIFDPFFTTKSRGMGMGLSVCLSIVQAHRGRLWASPGLQNGSIFRVTLPLDSPLAS